MNLPRVSVLLSTYNGEKFVREQINSILNQIDVDVQLLIRDDGSSDSTSLICKEYEDKYPNVSFYQGENIGVGRSFLELLIKAPDADYYSFADQDDVWLENKLAHAVYIIKQAEMQEVSVKMGEGEPIICNQLVTEESSCKVDAIPVLYGSNLIKVDEKLNRIGLRFASIPRCDFLSSISRNIIYGCTMVMNEALRDICINTEYPSDKILSRKNHDGWVLYIAYITGVFVYDYNSYIYYREHSSQVVGAKDIKGIRLIRARVIRLFKAKNKGVRSTLARELLERFSDRMKEGIKSNLDILSKANTLAGVNVLVRDKTLVDSFREPKVLIWLRGIAKWI